MTEPWTLRRILRWMQDDFEARGLASPRLDAELLVAHALEVRRIQLYMELERPLTETELGAIRALVKRRRAHEPVAYILGEREFWSRPFEVGPAVLIPRPDTEALVERALAVLASPSDDPATEAPPVREPAPDEPSLDPPSPPDTVDGEQTYELLDPLDEAQALLELDERDGLAPGSRDDTAAVASAAEDAPPADDLPPPTGSPPRSGAGPRVLDLCTGSGCIAISLAAERPDAQVTATDLSAEALSVARRNAERHAPRVRFLQGDLFAGARGPFDLITANPPYVAEADHAQLMPEVARHEPALALVAPDGGLAILKRIAREAPRHLAPGGTLLVEVGAGQADAVAALFREAGLSGVRTHADLGGVDRVVEGRLDR